MKEEDLKKLQREEALKRIDALTRKFNLNPHIKEQRFAHMGISSKVASDAVCSLVEADAVPQVGIWAALPSAFKGLFPQKSATSVAASDTFAPAQEALA